MAHSRTFVKQASLQEVANDAVRAAGETFSEIDLRNRPFRTLFKFLAPAALWIGGAKWLAILLGISEEFLGGGASTLGAMIDNALGFGGGIQGSVSDASLKGAAKNAVNGLLGGTMVRSSSFRKSVLERGFVGTEDLLAAWAAGPDLPMLKTAGPFKNWFRWLKQTGRGKRLPIISMLYQLLKSLVAGLGLYAGIKFVRKQFEKPKPFGLPISVPGIGVGVGAPSGARMDPSAGFAEWENIGGVERSITMALDKAVKDKRGRPFSALFAETQNRPLRGSPAMRRLLEDIRMAHGLASLREIDRYRRFLAPPIAETAKRLLPQLKYSPKKKPATDTTDIEKRLGRILGGGKQ